MARSKLALLLLVVLCLCGFDTRNPFRTRGPFKVADFTTGGGITSCTDGVDCYCDTISDASLILCEDFEDEDYYSDTLGSGGNPWYKSPSGNNGYRGGDSAWLNKYFSTDTGNWRSGNPASPTKGFTCGFSECGPAEYRADDAWQGNSESVIDIQRQGEVDDFVAGLTLDTTPDGQSWVGFRIKVGSTSGQSGELPISPAANSEIGYTAMIAYSSNMATAVSSAWTGDFTNQPWKHEEWGADKTTLFMGTVGGGGFPFSPGVWHSSQSACNSMVSGATFNAGSATCGPSVLQVTSDFDRSTSWPLGKWACVRGHISGLGTTDGRLRIYFNGTTVFDMDHADFSSGLKSTVNSMNLVSLNTYYNGNAPLPGAIPAVETFYKYQDRIHIRKGAPVDCPAGYQ